MTKCLVEIFILTHSLSGLNILWNGECDRTDRKLTEGMLWALGEDAVQGHISADPFPPKRPPHRLVLIMPSCCASIKGFTTPWASSNYPSDIIVAT